MLSVILEDELIRAFSDRLALIRLPSARVAVQGVSEGALLSALKALMPQVEHIDALRTVDAGSFDLILAPFVMPWHPDPRALLAEWRRILRPQGVLLFTALGPDTLSEWPLAHRQPALIDMHDLGDALVAAGFQEPVLDVEQLVLVYRDEKKFRDEVHGSGLLKVDALSFLPERDEEGRLPLSIELIYAHAFCADARSGEISVPVSAIERRYK